MRTFGLFTLSIAGLMVSLLILAACSASNAAMPQETTTDNSDSVVSNSAPTQATVRRGKLLFLQCRACHSLDSDGGHLVGPNLAGLFGSVAGSKDGFIYSEAATESTVIWNRQSLDEFLKNPNEFFPGTKMAFVGIANNDDRQALIHYLEANAQE